MAHSWKLENGIPYSLIGVGWKAVSTPEAGPGKSLRTWKVLRRECADNGIFTWSQTPGTPWKLATSKIPDAGDRPDPTIRLEQQQKKDITRNAPSFFLVREKQDTSELRHWLLAVADPEVDGYLAHVFQVIGDAEFMTYVPCIRTDVFTSDSYLDSFSLAPNISGDLLSKIGEVAASEHPLWAYSRKEVKENCQHWTVRVIARLTMEGIVGSIKLKDAQELVQPLGN